VARLTALRGGWRAYYGLTGHARLAWDRARDEVREARDEVRDELRQNEPADAEEGRQWLDPPSQ
jgi:hypothetical protein